ncbi:hypothetical protein GCM10022206_59370 [Streptomyces chiangmaiensis]
MRDSPALTGVDDFVPNAMSNVGDLAGARRASRSALKASITVRERLGTATQFGPPFGLPLTPATCEFNQPAAG